MTEKFNNLIHCFNILNSNIQGIEAKFDELKIFIEEIQEEYDFEFKAICLQECQFKDRNKTKLSQYKSDGYKMIPQG